MKFFEKIRKFILPPKLESGDPELRSTMHVFKNLNEDTVRRDNELIVAMEDLKLQKEALQRNLYLLHWSLVASLLSVIVAILAVVLAVSK